MSIFNKYYLLAEEYVLNETLENEQAKKEREQDANYLKEYINSPLGYFFDKNKKITSGQVISKIIKAKKSFKEKNKKNVFIITHDRLFAEIDKLDANKKYFPIRIVSFDYDNKNEKININVIAFDDNSKEKGSLKPQEVDVNKIGKNYKTIEQIKQIGIKNKKSIE